MRGEAQSLTFLNTHYSQYPYTLICILGTGTSYYYNTTYPSNIGMLWVALGHDWVSNILRVVSALLRMPECHFSANLLQSYRDGIGRMPLDQLPAVQLEKVNYIPMMIFYAWGISSEIILYSFEMNCWK